MQDEIRTYYGKVLQSSTDLQTNACCDTTPPEYLKPILASLHEDVVRRYFGCGLVAPFVLQGMRILDLGCGSGRDCYLLSALVGESGEVVGVDMTEEQLAVANRYRDYHRKAFGHAESNVRFLHGHIEHLEDLGLPPAHFDVVVSNCVINLCPDKAQVLRQIHRVLKPGGELYFSDVYADRRIPIALRSDPVLYGECLAGALYWNDFQTIAKATGFPDPRFVEHRPITVENRELEARLGPVSFHSATHRLFKIERLEPACEDYGQAVIYRGTVHHAPDAFVLDGHHRIETGRVFPVCGNTYRMLAETRFSDHFEFIGDFSRHFGIFPGCGISSPFDAPASGTLRGQSAASCC
jgi:arsenite methyltransferase